MLSMAPLHDTESTSRQGAPCRPRHSADQAVTSFTSRVLPRVSACLPMRPAVSLKLGLEVLLMSDAYSSLGSLLWELHGLFPPELIGVPGWERLRALTYRLPFCVTDYRFGFEFHLHDSSPTADFFVVSTHDTRLADFYRQRSEETAPGLVGDAFAAFIAEQALDPRSFLTRMGRGIILEYDLAKSPPGMHGIPGIFIVNRSYPAHNPVELHEDPAAFVAALQSAADELRQVECACAALADFGVGVSHAGVMPGRAERVIRLVVLNVESAKVAEVLECVQWPGEPSAALSVLADFVGLISPRSGLGIDITAKGVCPRLGIEISRLVENPGPEETIRLDRAGWKLIIDRLEERGWCLPAKAYAGMDVRRLSPQLQTGAEADETRGSYRGWRERRLTQEEVARLLGGGERNYARSGHLARE